MRKSCQLQRLFCCTTLSMSKLSRNVCLCFYLLYNLMSIMKVTRSKSRAQSLFPRVLFRNGTFLFFYRYVLRNEYNIIEWNKRNELSSFGTFLFVAQKCPPPNEDRGHLLLGNCRVSISGPHVHKHSLLKFFYFVVFPVLVLKSNAAGRKCSISM